MKKIITIVLIIITFFSCVKTKESSFISFKDSNILYTGRIELNTDSAAILYWPGTSIKLNFKGTDLKVLLKDTKGKNFYNIIIDNDSMFILRPDTIKQWYDLAKNLSNTKHTIEIFKRTEWRVGPTYLYGFETNKNTKLLPSPLPSKKTIEFFGNSITAGYAIGDTVEDFADSLFTDNYLTYGAITARHYNANYYCTARGGIGITISWFPMIMKEMYNRLNPEDSLSIWDFSKYTPDIVVINLFQNDSWLVEKPDYPEFKHRFGTEKPTEEFIINEYYKFVKQIRTIYPNAKIICALGSMDAVKKGSKWPGYIEQAVKKMNDEKIYTCVFPYINKDGHPKIKDHKVMADSLINFIDRNKLWN
jgi:hypothetical protein